MTTFKCFQHPTKTVEAVCTEPFCNYYRFFCVTCFLEQSAHFLNHKPYVHEVNEVVATHQSLVFKNAGVSEIQGNLNQIKQNLREYESLVKKK